MDSSQSVSAGKVVKERFALGTQWPTIDPFLFVAHHRDRYPPGNDRLGPTESLAGRQLGMDFSYLDGWSMYHGQVVPGFPQHPHRGFETITHVREGFVDHSDSLGATARFSRGDTQWMTAGAGVVHAEMFPLLETDVDNPLEMFQIWLNLPASDKMVDPYFTMFWADATPTIGHTTDTGSVEATIIAGQKPPQVVTPEGELLEVDLASPPPPPPNSWAAQPQSEVGVWYLRLAGSSTLQLPAAERPDTRRIVYVFAGSRLNVAAADGSGQQTIDAGTGFEVATDEPVNLSVEHGEVECIVLSGHPINEPVARYGPFVLNDQQGIQQAFEDYQRTGFGGWPWPSEAPVHHRDQARFARHADGRVETRS